PSPSSTPFPYTTLFRSALALIEVIERRQFGPSPQGTAMARALVDFHRSELGRLLPVGTYLMRVLSGDAVCDMLQVPHSPIRPDPIADALIDDTLRKWGTKLVFAG